jgi:hypothetical protein
VTKAPSQQPTIHPTHVPTHLPTPSPTEIPTPLPSPLPSLKPTYSLRPSPAPTFNPTTVLSYWEQRAQIALSFLVSTHQIYLLFFILLFKACFFYFLPMRIGSTLILNNEEVFKFFVKTLSQVLLIAYGIHMCTKPSDLAARGLDTSLYSPITFTLRVPAYILHTNALNSFIPNGLHFNH